MKKTNFTIRMLILGCMLFFLGGSAMAQINVTVVWNAGGFAGEVGWEIYNIATNNVVSCEQAGGGIPPATTNINIPAGTYEVTGWDSFGDSWNGGSLDVTLGGSVIFTTNGPAGFGFSPAGNNCATAPNDPDDFLAADFLGQFSVQEPQCEFTFCPGDVTVGSTPGLCGAEVEVEMPEVNDDCVSLGLVSTGAVEYNFNAAGLIATPSTVSGAIMADGDVTMTAVYTGDHGGTFEAFIVAGPDGGVFSGNLNNFTGGDCVADKTNSVTIPQALWNDWVDEFGSDLTFTLQADPDVDNICGTSEYELTFSYAVPPSPPLNNFNGTTNASGFYPVGVTEVCFTSFDVTGAAVECCFTVTVEDTEAPTFVNCPSNINVNLDPGACDQIVDFGPFEITDNCPFIGPVTSVFTESAGSAGNFFNGFSGVTFDVVNNGPTQLIIDSWDVPLTPAVAHTVQVWFTTTANTNVGNQTNAAAWTQLGEATVNANNATPDWNTANFTNIPVGGLALQPGESKGIYIVTNVGGAAMRYTNGNFTATDGTLTINSNGFAGGANFGNTFAGRAFVGVVNYQTGGGTGDVVQTDDTGLSSGDAFPIGETCLSFETEDQAGNVGTCEFCIVVKEFPNPILSLTCNDLVNISLDGDDCAEIVGADLVLEGGPYGCYDDYDVDLFFDEALTQPVNNNADNDELNGSNVGQTLWVRVSDPDNGNNSCWGQILVEDKVPPVLECTDLVIECNEPLPNPDDLTVSVPAGVKDYGVSPGVDVDLATNPEVDIDINVPIPPGVPVEDLDIFIDYAILNGCTAANHVFLTSPSGTVIDIWGSPNAGCGGDFPFLTCFDDESGNAFGDCFDLANGTNLPPPASLGAFANLEFLDEVDGEDAGGTWVFSISLTDGVANPGFCGIFGAPPDGGILNEVVLKLNTPGFVPLNVDDACGDVDLTFTDDVTKLGCDSEFSEIITRTYVATDPSGNSTTCVANISRRRGNLADVMVPPFWDDVSAPIRDCANPCLDPEYFPGDACYDPADPFGYGGGTGFPTNICSDVQFYFEDSPEIGLPDCPAGYKVLRQWTLIDWCTQEIINYDQVIKVSDNTAPNLNCPTQPISISVDNNCQGNVAVSFIASLVGASDDCSSISFSVDVNGQTFNQGQIITGLPLGNTPAVVTAVDACGNEATCNITLNIEDLIPPIAICDEFTTVGLGNLLYDADPFIPGLDANAELCFQTVDDGSYDNCEILAIKLRRMDGRLGSNVSPQFKDCVYFDCSDIGSSIMVQMRVYDKTGSFNNIDPFARYNECMVEVEVVDKVNPVIACPPSKTIECWEYDTEEVDGLLQISLEDLLQLNANNGSTGYPPNIPPAYLTVRKIDQLTGQIKSETNFGYVGGYPGATDNCAVDSVRILVIENVDNCGEGTVTRFYQAFEPIDPDKTTPDFSQCVQVITLEHTTPYDICDTQPWNTPALGCNFGHSLDDGIEWPADINLNGCGLGLDPEDLEMNPDVNPNDVRPRVFDDFCDLIGVDYEDTYLVLNGQAGASECIKLLRKWIIVDWCQEDPSFDLGYVTWTYLQEIKVLESNAPTFDAGACDDVTLCMDDDECNFVVSGPGTAINPNSTKETLEVTATDDCTPTENLNYFYKLDAFNDGIGAFGGYDFTSDFTYRDGDNRNFPSPPNILDTLNHDDDPSTTNIVEGKFPAGVHKLFWKVEDGCGNVTTCEYTFEVKDCKQPTPVCHNSIVTVVMPSSQMVDLKARFFDAGSYDNCTEDEDLIIAFSDQVTFDPITGAPIYDTVRTFTCDDVGPAIDIEIWVKDAPVGYDDMDVLDDNWDFCVTQVIIQDPNNVCQGGVPTAAVDGSINTEYDVPVGQVDVVANSNNGLTKTMTTQDDGQYSFQLNTGMNHSIEPTKDMNYKNGVSTYDLVLISQHIIGTLPLNSPYKIIAADANDDEKITVFDILELRKLILGLIDDLPENKSWRFVDAGHTFVNPSNPFQPAFPEVIDINDLTADELNNDFVAVKIGDVSNDVVANNLMAGSVDSRNFNGELVFGVQDVEMTAGETYTVEFTADNFSNITGYQFTIDFNSEVLNFVDVNAGNLKDLTVGNFGLTKVDNGTIVTSWNADDARLNDGDVVFSLTFAAKQNARLSDVMTVNSSALTAEAYTDVDFKNVALRFDTETGSKVVGPAFELYQNEPNPFKSETIIGFNLPEATNATLVIYDVSGKVLKSFKGDYAQGYNYLTINRSEIGAASGVLYYRLETADNSATKKMIIIE